MKNDKTSITAESVRNRILNAKGSFVKAAWKSNPKPKAEFKNILLEKHTVAVVQAGVNFANLSSVKQGIEEGTRGEVQELPFGEWWTCPITNKSFFPYIIHHKDEFYIRLTRSQGNNHKSSSVYYADGKEVTKEEFASYLTNSEAKKLLNPDPETISPVFNIKLKNLLDLPQDVD